MILCGKKLKISFLFSCLLVLGILLAGTPAKATITLDSYSYMDDTHKFQSDYVYMGFYATTTVCANPFLLVIANINSNGTNYITDITYNDVSMTQLLDNSSGTNGNVIYYTQNPDIGNHAVKIYQNWSVTIAQSFSFCGVEGLGDDMLSYWKNSGSWGNPINMTYDVSNDNSLFFAYSVFDNGSVYASTSETQILNTNWNNAHTTSWYSYKNGIENGILPWTIANGTIHTTGYLTLKPHIAPPSGSNATISVADGTAWLPIGGYFDIYYQYDWCTDYDYYVQNGLIIHTEIPREGIIYDRLIYIAGAGGYEPAPLGPYQCKGTGVFHQKVIGTTALIGTTTIAIGTSTNSTIVSSQEYPYERSLNNPGYYSLYTTFPSFKAITIATGTTTMPILFDFGDTDLASTSICIYDTKNLILRNCIAAISSPTSISITNHFSAYDLYYTLVLVDSNNNILFWSKSDEKKLSWFSDTNPNGTKIWDISGTKNYDNACSVEEWANATSSPAWFNFYELKCRSTLTLLNMLDNISSGVKSAINKSTDAIAGLFPVNLIVGLTTSWNASASSTLPTDMAWVTDEIDPTTGNITINPGASFASSTDLVIQSNPIVIWGEDMGGDDPQWDIWRIRIRAIIGWCIWAAWFWFQIIERAKRLYSYL